jgi:hypothetical protein
VLPMLREPSRQGATHDGGAGDVGASDDSLDSQEAPRKLHDNNVVLGFFRNAIAGPGESILWTTKHRDAQGIADLPQHRLFGERSEKGCGFGESNLHKT